MADGTKKGNVEDHAKLPAITPPGKAGIACLADGAIKEYAGFHVEACKCADSSYYKGW